MRAWVTASLAGMVLYGVLAATAAAQLVVDPARKAEEGAFETGVVGGLSTIEYEDDIDGDVKRLFVAAYGAYGINELIDAYGALGYTLKAEPEDWDGDGSGFFIGLGGRGLVADLDPVSLHAYAQFSYVSEDYGSSDIREHGLQNVDGEGTLWEIGGGLIAKYLFSDELAGYAGVELVPVSEGTVDLSTRGWSGDYDFERDTFFTVRGGVEYDMDGWWIRGDVAFGGELAFMVGAGTGF